MNFKIDENIPVTVKQAVTSAGHHAETALEEGLGGAADSVIFKRCQEEGRVILTFDRCAPSAHARSTGSHSGCEAVPLLRGGTGRNPGRHHHR